MTANTELAQAIQNLIRNTLPDADVFVHDPDGAHLSATVTSASFAGLTRIQQHRLVYSALGNAFENELHALQLTTRLPKAQ
ncbi:MAG: BolA family transcriptional regulator [Blastochloris viridis]|uniref:BolA family transcriptional regulator n=1 Tax=Blastochloris viridis TaxID=1079 RepID=A0A6N4R695_BLAVI|nr:MAG: BolA family transcriptional regulator [Blastochloris viridis]